MRSIRVRSDLQDYHNQTYIGSLLDDQVFDILNKGEDMDFLYKHGALDALDFAPAGSMRGVGGRYYDQSFCERGKPLPKLRLKTSS